MSKFGAHVSSGRRDGFGAALQQCADAGSPVPVLFSVDQDLWPDVSRYSPTTVLIYRTQIDTDDNPPTIYQGDPVATANAWYAKCAIKWRQNKANFYAPSNERNPSPEQDAWIDAFDLRMMQLADADGFKLALHGDSYGTPDYSQWQNYRTSLTYASQHGHILHLHEPVTGDDLALRYRTVHDLIQPFAPNLPIVISECYGDLGKPWNAYVDSFMPYDEEAMEDDYLIGFCAYQLGGAENWYTAIPHWADYVATHPTEENEPPEPPPGIESYNGEFIGSCGLLIDSAGNEWQLYGTHNPDAGYPVMRNDVQHFGGQAEALLYLDRGVFATNAAADWYRAVTTGWVKVNYDPRKIPAPDDNPFWCSYPVGGIEAPKITSRFNDPRPTYGSGTNHLHEGTDFDAYQNAIGENAPILAAQDGIVEYVNLHSGESYGLHIVIVHPWGDERDRYRTLYGHLLSRSVSVGQVVTRGQQIGIAGKTGTGAIHLHFNVHDAYEGLTGYVRCTDCSALWPDGVIDPETVIRYDTPAPVVGRVPIASLHQRADGGSLRGVDVQAAIVAKLNGYKLFDNSSSDYHTLTANGFDIKKVLVRLKHISDRRALPSDYINAQNTGIFDAPLREATAAGVVWFEFFNEPSEAIEGNGKAWYTPLDFCNLFKQVLSLARAKYPSIKVLSPALSQQDTRFVWWEMFRAYGVFAVSDGLAAHSYWDSGAYPMNDNANGRSYRALMPYLTGTQQIHVTEACNNGTKSSDVTKGQEYREYLNTMESQVYRVDFFCASSSNTGDGSTFNSTRQTWVRGDIMSDIPAEVGKA
jgi:hypothetical protein